MNNHKAAIEILADANVDYRAIVYEIAMNSPDVLVNAASSMGIYKRESDLVKKARSAGGKAAAVKIVRDETGMMLNEAIDWIEKNTAFVS